MGLLNRSDKPSNTNNKTTIMTEGSFIKGELKISCSLYVNGKIEGDIDSSSDIIIGENGFIHGNVLSNKIIVKGYMEGNIKSNRVEILNNGTTKGTIESQELIIEATARFEGESKRLKTDVLKKELPIKKDKDNEVKKIVVPK